MADEIEEEISDTQVSISTPIDDDVTFSVTKITAFEAISKPFVIDVTMHASLEEISDLDTSSQDIFELMVGGDCCISINFHEDPENTDEIQTRYFSGIIGEFKYCGDRSVHGEIHAQYKMKIYPKFWTLKYVKDYRIFQSLTSSDIIESIFDGNEQDIDNENAIEDDDEDIEERDYCVQYGETTYDFVSRLMEEDGIFYYFKHDEDTHTMQMSNVNDDFTDIEDAEGEIFTLEMPLSGTESRPYFNSLLKAEFLERITPEKYVALEFDFKQPSDSLEADTTDEDEDFTIYEYPARYTSLSLGDSIAQRRLEGKQVSQFTFSGESTAPFFSAGYVFELEAPEDKEGWKEEWNQEYVINTVSHTFDFQGQFMIYKNKFTTFPKDTPFRPHRLTERPKIYGADTAIVVGPEDTEIYTDEYARIKVKFHWDHDDDQDDDTRTCWIRVVQSFAGEGFGSLFTPRVGQEVLITFINGNPDRPIVTGALYNADNMPLYRAEDGDDDHKPEITSIRTQSTPDAEGYNEIRFDDTAEEEDFYTHAQKDMHIEVCETQDSKIGGDISVLVKNNRYVEVRTGDDNLVITAGSRRVDIIGESPDDSDFFEENGDLDEDLEVTTIDDLEDVEESFEHDDDDGPGEANETTVIHAGDRRVLLLSGNDKTILESGNQVITLSDGNRHIDVEGDETHHISGNYDLTVDGDFNIVVGGDFNIEVAGDWMAEVEGDIDFTSEGSISMSAAVSVNIQAGGAINITAGGIITVQTVMMITISGGMISAKALTTFSISAGLSVSVTALLSSVSISSKLYGGIKLSTLGAITNVSGSMANIASGAILSKANGLWAAQGSIAMTKGKVLVASQASILAVVKALLTKIN